MAYAVSGTGAEQNVRVGMSLYHPLWHEVVKTEIQSAGEMLGHAMYIQYQYHEIYSCR